ncbi:MAG: hypothetical protein DIZ78_06360 [endosymbiont of Escarpia spicata]|uniref:Lipoprotein n=1 Tax=endosymbiont of Escarpia spicata TaxID=2200908 RepID=A0A370DSG9_9GAMM|nr:MAG: hypothetical protein DIZ78_06360 [endosymbiont of Escarpia spicata]
MQNYLRVFVAGVLISCSSVACAERYEKIKFPVTSHCVNDVVKYLNTLQSIDGFYGEYHSFDYDGGVDLGVSGYAIIGSIYKDKESLKSYVNGSIVKCLPKRTKVLDLHSVNGLDELSEFLMLRKINKDKELYLLLKDGTMRIYF